MIQLLKAHCFKAGDEDPVQVSNYFASARIANVLQLARVSARAAIDMLDDYSRQLADALAAAGGPAAPGSP